MGQITNLRIGECEVYYDKQDGAGERNLGHTKGGIEIEIDRELVEITVDQYGISPVDLIANGQNFKVKVMLAEPTNENLSVALPEGNYAAYGSDSKIGIGRDSGYSLRDVAGVLRLHPRKNAPSNRNEDVYIWKAVSSEPIALPYKIDEQRLLEITFQALVDETRPSGSRLGQVGDDPIS